AQAVVREAVERRVDAPVLHVEVVAQGRVDVELPALGRAGRRAVDGREGDVALGRKIVERAAEVEIALEASGEVGAVAAEARALAVRRARAGRVDRRVPAQPAERAADRQIVVDAVVRAGGQALRVERVAGRVRIGLALVEAAAGEDAGGEVAPA